MKKLKLLTPKWVAWLMLPIKKLIAGFLLRGAKANDKKNKRFIHKMRNRIGHISSNTYRLLKEDRDKHYHYSIGTLPFAGALMFICLLFSIRWKALLVITVLELCIFGINYLLVRKSLRKNARIIYRNDRHELLLSKKLQETLNSFTRGSLLDYENDTMPLDGVWKPFDVLHVMNSNIRTEFSGKLQLNGGFLSGASSGKLEGNSKGIVVPNLLDSSTLLFLVDSQEKTVRVLIPSPSVVIEFVKQVLESLSEDCCTKGSHVYDVLKDVSIKNLTLANPKVIDEINFSCQKPLGERPKILLSGHLIKPGVFFASSIEVNGVKSLFYPLGFLKSLMKSISPYTNSIPSEQKLRMVA